MAKSGNSRTNKEVKKPKKDKKKAASVSVSGGNSTVIVGKKLN